MIFLTRATHKSFCNLIHSCAIQIATLKLDCPTVINNNNNKMEEITITRAGNILIFRRLSIVPNLMSAMKPWNTIFTTIKTRTIRINNNKTWHSLWDHTATKVKSFLDSSRKKLAPSKLHVGPMKRCSMVSIFLIRLLPLLSQSACLARCPMRMMNT